MQGRAGDFDRIVVMPSRGADRARKGAALEGGAVLDLEQEGVGVLGVDAEPPLYRPLTERPRARRADRDAVLSVALQRLAEQEVLQELHPRTADGAADLVAAAVAGLGQPLAGDARAVGVAEGLGVRVALAQHRVAVGIEAADEAGGLLVEARGGRAQAQFTGAERALVYGIRFPFTHRGLGAESVLVAEQPVERGRVIRGRELQREVIVRAARHTEAQPGQGVGIGGDHIDEAVDGIGTVGPGARAAQHLDGGSL